MIDTIMKRRSIRKYTDQKVTDEQIGMLLDAAMAARLSLAVGIMGF
ncbi:MAG: hypothetical protein COV46_08630 [Deltaproteobacteria bacterium CG11_big_fil_rev_8_21_14_0_20_49_13]|nr:MAG: hypothetical protein COV46_08630 [Deltaproteobacteria bacterium CG11_big_fil_rev_8_21_14_0_20_49_13]